MDFENCPFYPASCDHAPNQEGNLLQNILESPPQFRPRAPSPSVMFFGNWNTGSRQTTTIESPSENYGRRRRVEGAAVPRFLARLPTLHESASISQPNTIQHTTDTTTTIRFGTQHQSIGSANLQTSHQSYTHSSSATSYPPISLERSRSPRLRLIVSSRHTRRIESSATERMQEPGACHRCGEIFCKCLRV